MRSDSLLQSSKKASFWEVFLLNSSFFFIQLEIFLLFFTKKLNFELTIIALGLWFLYLISGSDPVIKLSSLFSRPLIRHINILVLIMILVKFILALIHGMNIYGIFSSFFSVYMLWFWVISTYDFFGSTNMRFFSGLNPSQGLRFVMSLASIYNNGLLQIVEQ